MKCPFCKSEKWKEAGTDLGLGFFKAEGMKPVRMKPRRCEGCGFVAIFAPKEEKKA